MRMTDTSTIGIDDVGELYGRVAKRLEAIVRRDVHAPEVVIEDACQIAWSQLLHHRHRVHRESVMSWLASTAVREAFRLLRRTRRELSLDAAGDAWPRSEATLAEMIECRARLAELGRLPRRQQRAVWLHGAGLSYAEIARHEGCTTRTVERQLLRARQAIRQLEAA
jgi:RNA polymerase sigma factor (sigma-70 family)